MEEITKPLVSVIIRTIGREAGVRRAISSVASQTYANIELVVVNDSDGDLGWVRELGSGSIAALRLIDNPTNHGRCRAANIGLDNSGGTHIMFLDDDDWVDAGHVEKLVRALSSKPGAILVHTDTLVVDENEARIGRFEFALESKYILAGNFMPIHSVLFRSSALGAQCRFDEALEIYEDWDFWIQLSRLGSFAHVSGFSAYYALAHGGSSDAHKADKAHAASVQVLRKWLPLWSDDELVFLAGEAVKARGEIGTLKLENEALKLENKSLRHENKTLTAQLATIINSRSWKATKAPRRLADIAKTIIKKSYNRSNIFYKDLIRKLEIGDKFNGDIRYESDFYPRGGDKLCVFSHFDKDGIIDEYVVYYLQALRDLGSDIVFVSTALKTKEEAAKIENICSKIILKQNIGYDFGAWSTGIASCLGHVKNYETMILCNDSVYAPLFELSEMFDAMRKRNLDGWSITDSIEVSYHLQSYFLVFGQNVLADLEFWNFWRKYVVYKNKRNIIIKYEIGLSKLLQERSFKIGAYCETSALTTSATNITHSHWEELIAKLRCPSIKIELLRDNPIKMDIDRVEEVIADETQYPLRYIVEHLKRVSRR